MKLLITFSFIFVLVSCNGGLEPPTNTYLKGTIYFSDKDTWPPSDSLKDLRLVALKNYPPADIVSEITSGNAYFTESLPLYQDSVDFELEISDAPVELKYIGVAQNYGTLLEWKVVGFYSKTNDTVHTEIFMNQGIDRTIIINVDFNNIPKQPFEL